MNNHTQVNKHKHTNENLQVDKLTPVDKLIYGTKAAGRKKWPIIVTFLFFSKFSGDFILHLKIFSSTHCGFFWVIDSGKKWKSDLKFFWLTKNSIVDAIFNQKSSNFAKFHHFVLIVHHQNWLDHKKEWVFWIVLTK